MKYDKDKKLEKIYLRNYLQKIKWWDTIVDVTETEDSEKKKWIDKLNK